MQNGKGKGPEKGRNLPKFREGYDLIDWGRPESNANFSQAEEPSKPPASAAPANRPPRREDF